MSSFNKILKKVRVGTVTKDGKEIVLSVATSTSNWNRTEDMAKQQGSAFKAAVENSLNVVGRDTKEICSRSVLELFLLVCLPRNLYRHLNYSVGKASTQAPTLVITILVFSFARWPPMTTFLQMGRALISKQRNSCVGPSQVQRLWLL